MKILVLALTTGSLLSAQRPATFSPADLERGKKLYEGHCSLCHGQTGTGGKGPSLAQPTLRHAPDDAALAEVIKNGIPNSEMPGAWQLTGREASQVAGYVRSLGRTVATPLPGDPERGRKLYESAGGCAACHILGGTGVSLGPELTEIGAQRSADYLRESLLKPGAQVPEGFMLVSVTTRDGKTMRGIRANEDTFTIQVRDSSNRFHSFRKRDVTVKKEFHESLMPSYESRFSAAELDDLVAYLATLRGKS